MIKKIKSNIPLSNIWWLILIDFLDGNRCLIGKIRSLRIDDRIIIGIDEYFIAADGLTFFLVAEESCGQTFFASGRYQWLLVVMNHFRIHIQRWLLMQITCLFHLRLLFMRINRSFLLLLLFIFIFSLISF